MAASSGARVEFLGHRSGGDLERLVAGARAIVVPSRWPSNRPLVVLEAMAAAKPLVASRVGGIPELSRDGEEALLVPHGEVAPLREAMLRLQELRRAGAAAGRRRAAAGGGSRTAPRATWNRSPRPTGRRRDCVWRLLREDRDGGRRRRT